LQGCHGIVAAAGMARRHAPLQGGVDIAAADISSTRALVEGRQVVVVATGVRRRREQVQGGAGIAAADAYNHSARALEGCRVIVVAVGARAATSMGVRSAWCCQRAQNGRGGRRSTEALCFTCTCALPACRLHQPSSHHSDSCMLRAAGLCTTAASELAAATAAERSRRCRMEGCEATRMGCCAQSRAIAKLRAAARGCTCTAHVLQVRSDCIATAV
jgi:hypothetical protein